MPKWYSIKRDSLVGHLDLSFVHHGRDLASNHLGTR